MTHVAKPLITNALKTIWNNLIDSNSDVNIQLVKKVKDSSGKIHDGTYTFSVTNDTSEIRSMWTLVKTGAGLFSSNMDSIIIWGLDEECYNSLSRSVLINGGISLVTIGNILSQHCFEPGKCDEIDRFTTMGQVMVRYKVYKKQSL